MCILAVGAICSGKFIFLVDLSNLNSAHLPHWLGNLINYITILGVVLGLTSPEKERSRFILNSLFLLTPFVARGTISILPLRWAIRGLDHG